MPTSEQTMTPAQMATLLDAALRHRRPIDYFNVAAVMFGMTGREADRVATTWIGTL